MKKSNIIILTLIMILICNIGSISAHSSSTQLKPTLSHNHTLYGVGNHYIGNTATNVFHKSNCAFAKKIKNKIILNSKNEALDMGYSPCKHCKP